MTKIGFAVRWTGALVVVLAPVQAFAQSRVTLDSAVFIEKTEDAVRVLEPASHLSPGDRVVTVVTWRREVPGGAFTLTNPVPRGVHYQSSSRDDEDVSVDGGHTWGRLGSLRIANRFATPEDVTHLRWKIASPQPSGRIAYSAIVR